MKQVVKISDLPNVLSIDELLEVKGGLGDNNTVCSVVGTGTKCDVPGSGTCYSPGSGICPVAGSGMCSGNNGGICTAEGSGIITKDPSPDKPGPVPGD